MAGQTMGNKPSRWNPNTGKGRIGHHVTSIKNKENGERIKGECEVHDMDPKRKDVVNIPISIPMPQH